MAGPIRISILTDAKGAVSGLDDTGHAADRLGTKLGGAAKAAVKYAAAGAALAAGAAVVGLAKLAAGAAEDQQAATLLATALKKSAGATDTQVAATERYISKVGVATGITDDELRPALTKFAQATGSVTEAQKATNLAMDVAAGSNTNLTAVTKTLAKAYTTGSVTALSKYGIEAKNADGSTKTLAQATDELGKKFGGSAAAKADTLQGKISRLKLIVSEAGETIGYKVIPVLTTFADYIATKVVPTVIDLGGKSRYVLVPVFETIADVVTGKVVPAVKAVIGFFDKYQDILIPVAAGIGAIVLAFTAYSVVMGIVSSVTAAYTAVQVALNLAMTANPIGLLVLALVGIAAALGVAYARSETFRDIVQGAFAVVQTVVGGVVGFFTDKVPAAFNTVIDAAGSVVGWVKSNWPTLLAIITGPIGLAVLLITKNWGDIKDGASAVKGWITDRFDDVVTFVTGLPARISSGAAGLFDKVKDLAEGAKKYASDKLDDLVTTITGLPSRISSAASGMFDGISGAFKAAINYVIGKWNDLELSIPAIDTHIPGVGKVGGFTLGTPDIPLLANGGIVNRATLAVIGEAGPEAVVPLDGRFFGGPQSFTISVKLTAEQVDQLTRGREIQLDLDAAHRAGVRPGAA